MNTPKTRPGPGRTAAFTLVELLSVLAIVALLAAIALVAVGRVKTQAALATSLGNVRSLQLANLQYATDHKGHYVAVAGWDDKGAQTASWCNHIEYRAYLAVPPPPASWPRNLVSPFATIPDANGNVDMMRSYGYNSTTLVAVWGAAGAKAQASQASVSAPAQTLAFADALDWQISIWGSNRYTGEEVYTTSAVAFRYHGKAAVAYFDGHTGALKRDEVVNNTKLWEIYK